MKSRSFSRLARRRAAAFGAVLLASAAYLAPSARAADAPDADAVRPVLFVMLKAWESRFQAVEAGEAQAFAAARKTLLARSDAGRERVSDVLASAPDIYERRVRALQSRLTQLNHEIDVLNAAYEARAVLRERVAASLSAAGVLLAHYERAVEQIDKRVRAVNAQMVRFRSGEHPQAARIAVARAALEADLAARADADRTRVEAFEREREEARSVLEVASDTALQSNDELERARAVYEDIRTRHDERRTRLAEDISRYNAAAAAYRSLPEGERDPAVTGALRETLAGIEAEEQALEALGVEAQALRAGLQARRDSAESARVRLEAARDRYENLQGEARARLEAELAESRAQAGERRASLRAEAQRVGAGFTESLREEKAAIEAARTELDARFGGDATALATAARLWRTELDPRQLSNPATNSGRFEVEWEPAAALVASVSHVLETASRLGKLVQALDPAALPAEGPAGGARVIAALPRVDDVLVAARHAVETEKTAIERGFAGARKRLESTRADAERQSGRFAEAERRALADVERAFAATMAVAVHDFEVVQQALVSSIRGTALAPPAADRDTLSRSRDELRAAAAARHSITLPDVPRPLAGLALPAAGTSTSWRVPASPEIGPSVPLEGTERDAVVSRWFSLLSAAGVFDALAADLAVHLPSPPGGTWAEALHGLMRLGLAGHGDMHAHRLPGGGRAIRVEIVDEARWLDERGGLVAGS